MSRSILAALILGGTLVAGAVRADIVTYNFTGTLTDTSALGVDAGTLVPNTFAGNYSFDSAVAARAGSTSTFAVFDALTAFSASYDGNTVTANAAASEIQVDDNPGGGFHDRYALILRDLSPLYAVGGLTLTGLSFRLDDSTDAVFADALDLPVDLSLGDFDGNLFFAFFSDSGGDVSVVVGVLDSLTRVVATDVPAPAALLLLGTALVMFGAARRKSA